jgi:hypothetical protein
VSRFPWHDGEFWTFTVAALLVLALLVWIATWS